MLERYAIRAVATIAALPLVRAGTACLTLAPRCRTTVAEMKLSLHYNPDCPDCRRRAARTARLDWLQAIELRTDHSPLGEVPVGEIVVVDERRRRVFTGVYATRKVCLRIPLLYLYGLLLCVPSIRRLVGGSEPGCNGNACDV